MEVANIYQDDRINRIREFNSYLKKSVASIGHQKYDDAREYFDEAVISGLEAVKDNNQFYIKSIFQTYLRYYAAFRKIKYDEGAKWCLLHLVVFLRRLKMSKENRLRIIADIIQKYELAGGDRNDVKEKWKNPVN